jgi:3,4-dihydroxy 2-butanone 4-phosphate synthase/GTP cyclohydrolase II
VTSFDAARGIQSGVSASDRAQTILSAVNSQAIPDDVVFPGHVAALQARPNGVLDRRGHTEGAVDLAKLAGGSAAAVICEIIDANGEPARGEALSAFANLHRLKVGHIAALVEHQQEHRR